MIQKFLISAGQKAKNILFPPTCPVSYELLQEHGCLAPHVWQKLHFIAQPNCVECGEPFYYAQQGDGRCVICLSPEDYRGRVTSKKTLDNLRSAVAYDEQSANLVLGLKYADRHDLSELLGKLMVQAGRDYWEEDNLLIVPVPLHTQRLRHRRFNQAALLSDYIAGEVEGKHVPDLLIRTRSTKPQQGMSAKARQRNVRNAFMVREKYRDFIKGKKIVLIDDVFTTGSTMKESARALKKANAANVKGLTFARVVKDPVNAI